MKIRRYNSSDCDEILKLFYDTVHTVNAAHYSPCQLDVWAPVSADKERWNSSLLSHFSVVAQEG